MKEQGNGAVIVRANHGHGIPDVEVVERELTPQDAVGYAVHVTLHQAWSLIRYEGIKRGDRCHVHFAGRAPEQGERIAGVCNGGVVCVFVDQQRAMSDGLRLRNRVSHQSCGYAGTNTQRETEVEAF